ncbi:MAG: hypothetical protein KGZ74_12080 [Chitinophagaceae bacterium]|nr:hypothetical protein [Chitinophagaceae bacterium]
MAAETFNVDIKGYWRDRNKADIPRHSGVYFVYTGTYDSIKNTVDLKRLIYIGEAENVNDRIQNHEKYSIWLRYLQNGEELVFSTGEVAAISRARVEAAYIFKHKPPANTEYLNSFPFDQTTIVSSGKTKFLNTHFTVHRLN